MDFRIREIIDQPEFDVMRAVQCATLRV